MINIDFAGKSILLTGAMGAIAEHVRSIADLEGALQRAKAADRTTVIVVDTDPANWTPGDAWWDVGVPQISARPEVIAAHAEQLIGRERQRHDV